MNKAYVGSWLRWSWVLVAVLSTFMLSQSLRGTVAHHLLSPELLDACAGLLMGVTGFLF